MKNQFKRAVTKITDQEIYDNLNDWYKSATRSNRKAGKSWYKDAQSFCKDTAKKYDLDSYIVASVVSGKGTNMMPCKSLKDF